MTFNHCWLQSGFLKETPYLAGNQFTLADIAGVTATLEFKEKMEAEKVPMVQKWFKTVMDRPSVKQSEVKKVRSPMPKYSVEPH